MVKAAGGTGVITFVNSSSQTVIDGTNLILSMPAGLQEGDVVCAVAAMNVAIPAEPSGWTTINTNGRVRAIIKVMGSTPDTSADWGDSGSAIQSGAAVAMAFRGVDPTTPQDVTAQNINSSADPQPITPSSNNCCIVILSGASTLDTTIGTITGYSTPVAAAASNSASSTAGACYRILSGGGGAAEDPAAWSTWSISGNGGSHTVALRPWL
jgi:hypothetical protein